MIGPDSPYSCSNLRESLFEVEEVIMWIVRYRLRQRWNCENYTIAGILSKKPRLAAKFPHLATASSSSLYFSLGSMHPPN